ncbi:spore coat protein [Bacillus sp. DJP31]|uniref:spore coat protein n=1 Tax=Bacillus sp. DJP31 TaxID=3409789 RepID=UPI003BB5CDE2
MAKTKKRRIRRKRRQNHENATVVQQADQFSYMEQESTEGIIIRDSVDVTVQTTDTQVAVSLQVAIQAAIALVISITIGDSDRSKAVAQEIMQKFVSEQENQQLTVIENSKNVTVTTTDTDVAVNIQALLQVLLTLVVRLDVL